MSCVAPSGVYAPHHGDDKIERLKHIRLMRPVLGRKKRRDLPEQSKYTSHPTIRFA